MKLEEYRDTLDSAVYKNTETVINALAHIEQYKSVHAYENGATIYWEFRKDISFCVMVTRNGYKFWFYEASSRHDVRLSVLNFHNFTKVEKYLRKLGQPLKKFYVEVPVTVKITGTYRTSILAETLEEAQDQVISLEMKEFDVIEKGFLLPKSLQMSEVLAVHVLDAKIDETSI